MGIHKITEVQKREIEMIKKRTCPFCNKQNAMVRKDGYSMWFCRFCPYCTSLQGAE